MSFCWPMTGSMRDSRSYASPKSARCLVTILLVSASSPEYNPKPDQFASLRAIFPLAWSQ